MSQPPFNDIKIRIAPDLKQWLSARALANSRSLNGEVLHLIKQAKEADHKKGVMRG